MKFKSLSFKINAALFSTAFLLAVLLIGLFYALEETRYEAQLRRIVVFLETVFLQKKNDLALEPYTSKSKIIEASVDEIAMVVKDIAKACLYDHNGVQLYCSGDTIHHFLVPQDQFSLGKNHFNRNFVIGEKAFCLYINEIPVNDDNLRYLSIYYNVERILQEKSRTLFLFSLLLCSTISLMTFFLHLILLKSIIHPVTALREGLKRVEKGSPGESIQLNRNDEIGEMGAAINNMSLKLICNKEEIERHRDTLEELVAERTNDIIEAK